MKLVNVYAAGSNYYLTPGKDDALIEKVRTLHQTIIDDKDYILGYRSRTDYAFDVDTASTEMAVEDAGAQSTISNIRITYMLNSGLKVERRYSLYLTSGRMAQEGTYDYLLDQLINSPEMRQKCIRWRDEGFQLDGAWIDTWRDYSDLSSREVGLILDAVARTRKMGTGACITGSRRITTPTAMRSKFISNTSCRRASSTGPMMRSKSTSRKA